MLYKRTEIANLMGISDRTLRRIIIRENIAIKKNCMLTVRDIKLIDNELGTSIMRFIK